ncbi:MFS transporter [Occultella glacieicola]|uniref:MFS transporter n=1 Tax=Occultella glacieicola TaxID=2518684 RepID=A0ABY2E4I9_9MICO|nr:MFS transporter [Occultella glacieicola]TDE91668.1 MFS transporter [Occultella glacieicola]
MTASLDTTPKAKEPLGHRFVALFASTAASNLADGILLVAVPLIGLTLTTSPLRISLLSAATWLPWLLLGLYAGALIDRGDRRRIMVAAMGLRMVVLTLATAAALTDSLTMPVLLGLLLVFGAAEVFADTAAGTLIPAVTPRARLASANGRLLGVQQVANQFVGAPLGGFLLTVGPAWAFGVPGLLCGVAIGCIGLGLRGSYRAGDHVGGVRVPGTGTSAQARDETSAESIGTRILAGLRYLLGHAVLRPLVITSAAMNLANSAYFAVFVLWLVGPGSAVGLSEQMYAILITTVAIGALLGSVLAEHLLARVSETRLLGVVWVVNSALLAVPVLVPDAWVIGAAFVVVGFTNIVGNVITRAMRQRLIPDALLGRVGGASATVTYGTMPIGALLGGVVGEAFGLPAVFLGAVGLCLIFVAYTISRVTPVVVAQADADRAVLEDAAAGSGH